MSFFKIIFNSLAATLLLTSQVYAQDSVTQTLTTAQNSNAANGQVQKRTTSQQKRVRRPASQTQKKQKNSSAKRPIKKSSTAEAPKPDTKSAGNNLYKEIQLSYGFTTDSFKLRSEGTLGSLRAQVKTLNLSYMFYRPSKNVRLLYNYGFSVGYGTLKGIAAPIADFGNETKDSTWMSVSALAGVDFRNSYRTRVGLFIPFSVRFINFDLPSTIKVSKQNEPYSLGVGARYVNAISNRSAIALAFSYQYFWQSGTWDLSWQYRL